MSIYVLDWHGTSVLGRGRHNKRQRRAEEKQVNNVSTEVRAFGLLRQNKILSEVHQFEEVVPSQAAVDEAAMLSAETFRAPLRQSTLPLSSIISSKSGAWWYSPSSSNECQIYADMELLEWCARRRRLHQLSDRWLGCLMPAGKVLVRERAPGSRYYSAPGDVPGSSALGWPAQERCENGVTFFAPQDSGASSFSYLNVVCLDDLEAWSFEWRSPVWFHANGIVGQRAVAAVPTTPGPERLCCARKPWVCPCQAMVRVSPVSFDTLICRGQPWGTFRALVHTQGWSLPPPDQASTHWAPSPSSVWRSTWTSMSAATPMCSV